MKTPYKALIILYVFLLSVSSLHLSFNTSSFHRSITSSPFSFVRPTSHSNPSKYRSVVETAENSRSIINGLDQDETASSNTPSVKLSSRQPDTNNSAAYRFIRNTSYTGRLNKSITGIINETVSSYYLSGDNLNISNSNYSVENLLITSGASDTTKVQKSAGNSLNVTIDLPDQLPNGLGKLSTSPKTLQIFAKSLSTDSFVLDSKFDIKNDFVAHDNSKIVDYIDRSDSIQVPLNSKILEKFSLFLFRKNISVLSFYDSSNNDLYINFYKSLKFDSSLRRQFSEFSHLYPLSEFPEATSDPRSLRSKRDDVFLTILGLFELTSHSGHARAEGFMELKAARLAVDHVNRLSNLLGPFKLKLITNDTKVIINNFSTVCIAAHSSFNIY